MWHSGPCGRLVHHASRVTARYIKNELALGSHTPLTAMLGQKKQFLCLFAVFNLHLQRRPLLKHTKDVVEDVSPNCHVIIHLKDPELP